tara:strand:+ start:121 stop:435 length:315 start_codon:yes stop_codon:yes gene_type:complete
MMHFNRLWTFDAALHKKNQLDTYKQLKFKKVSDTRRENEARINVWRKVTDDLGRVYLWNIVTMETKWPEPQRETTINILSNKRFSYCDIESLHNNKIFLEKKRI